MVFYRLTIVLVPKLPILYHSCLPCCRHIISSVSRDTRLLSLVTQSGIKNTLITMLDQLQRCQKSLNEFLEVFMCIISDTSFVDVYLDKHSYK